MVSGPATVQGASPYPAQGPQFSVGAWNPSFPLPVVELVQHWALCLGVPGCGDPIHGFWGLDSEQTGEL